MAKQQANFIAGEWVEGAEVTRNVNPSDTNDVVGEYARASAAERDAALRRVGASLSQAEAEAAALLDPSPHTRIARAEDDAAVVSGAYRRLEAELAAARAEIAARG